MKRIWMLVLLVSLGLNLGLGLRLLAPTGGSPGAGTSASGDRTRSGPGWERRAGADSTTWRHFLDRRLDRLARRLDLRPEQVARLRDLQADLGRDLRRERADLLAARTRVRDQLAAGPIDPPAARRAMAEIRRRQAAVDSLAAEIMLREIEVLDPGQRSGYLDFMPGEGEHGSGRSRRGRDKRSE